MKQKRIDEMLAHIKQTVGVSAFRKLSESADGTQHFSAGQLYRYARGELADENATALRRHLALCPSCNGKTLRIMRIASDWTPPAALFDELCQDVADWIEQLSKAASSVCWATRLWSPEWAGMPVYASDIPEQQHTFSGQEGEIELSCSWRDGYGTTPAYLTISWIANVTVDRKLWAVFFDPETKNMLAEIPLGKHRDGGKSLTSEILGFNPSHEKWAVALLLKAEDS